jgi:hypothetical protein
MYTVAQRVRAWHGTEVINILAMSAGGADGAFGASALVGLTHSGSRPQSKSGSSNIFFAG